MPKGCTQAGPEPLPAGARGDRLRGLLTRAVSLSPWVRSVSVPGSSRATRARTGALSCPPTVPCTVAIRGRVLLQGDAGQRFLLPVRSRDQVSKFFERPVLCLLISSALGRWVISPHRGALNATGHRGGLDAAGALFGPASGPYVSARRLALCQRGGPGSTPFLAFSSFRRAALRNSPIFPFLRLAPRSRRGMFSCVLRARQAPSVRGGVGRPREPLGGGPGAL